jgi:branched-chain amino acid transport system substrate-binding protein
MDKNVDQFRQPGKQVVLYPPQYKTGDVMAPFEKARSSR